MRKNVTVGIIIAAAVTFVSLMLPSVSSISFALPKGEPIVFGYVGNVSSPGTKPCMDIQKMAVEEINAAGGILGRPVKYVVLDGKGDAILSVEAARKLLIEDKATFVCVEGRTEICLAVQEASGMLFKEYPHILQFNGPAGSELTARILDQAPKYDQCFRDWQPEAAYWAHIKYYFTNYFQKTLKAKKLAILWEDLAWTNEFRKGIPSLNLPPWEQLAKDCGLEVVYSKPVKPRGTLYIPILQQIADSKADLIYYMSSWFTDSESFVKQWVDSSAKDIPVCFDGGVAMTAKFWDMTGGKALGVVSIFTDLDTVPLTPVTMPLVKKARERGIPMQLHVHLAYADIYHFKAAIEKAKGTSNIKKLIKGMEDAETVYSLGKMKYQTQKIKPFYHSTMRVDPKNPYKTYPGRFLILQAQFQNNGKIVYISDSSTENEKATQKYWNSKNYKTPAELRKQ
jgi:ABC-type branched-subunit amino acid transport system substrate-binding protein